MNPGREGTRLLAGVDEAGLGPILGPLAIGWSVLRIPAGESDPWRLLSPTVSKNPNRRARLLVADSKRVFHQDSAGLRRLENTALGFLSLFRSDKLPPDRPEDVLFGALKPSKAERARHPWYQRLPALPRILKRESVELTTALLERRMRARAVELVDAGVRIVPSGELNASFARTRNKAASVWTRMRQVLRRLWLVHGEEHPDVLVDMLGGRVRYAVLLEQAFADVRVRVLFERPLHSAYFVEEVRAPQRRMRIDFQARGEDASFAVALASCLAKYARELEMSGFNAFFATHDPTLRPTAGYRNDAQRWLREAERAISSSGVERGVIVRAR